MALTLFPLVCPLDVSQTGFIARYSEWYSSKLCSKKKPISVVEKYNITITYLVTICYKMLIMASLIRVACLVNVAQIIMVA